jgi:hypothetical protein
MENIIRKMVRQILLESEEFAVLNQNIIKLPKKERVNEKELPKKESVFPESDNNFKK